MEEIIGLMTDNDLGVDLVAVDAHYEVLTIQIPPIKDQPHKKSADICGDDQ